MEDCRIITSFYFPTKRTSSRMIGRLPYYYFLLLAKEETMNPIDWKTAVLLLPSTNGYQRLDSERLEDCRIITSFYYVASLDVTSMIGRLPYYYFLLLAPSGRVKQGDWKTAVLLLPSTSQEPKPRIGRLEDCRIITSFYSQRLERFQRIDWKTAVLLLPSTLVSSS